MASWTGCRPSLSATPSTVVISRPSAATASTRQDVTGSTVDQNGTGAAVARGTPLLGAGSTRGDPSRRPAASCAARGRGHLTVPLTFSFDLVVHAALLLLPDRSCAFPNAALTIRPVSTRTISRRKSAEPLTSLIGRASSAAVSAAFAIRSSLSRCPRQHALRGPRAQRRRRHGPKHDARVPAGVGARRERHGRADAHHRDIHGAPGRMPHVG